MLADCRGDAAPLARITTPRCTSPGPSWLSLTDQLSLLNCGNRFFFFLRGGGCSQTTAVLPRHSACLDIDRGGQRWDGWNVVLLKQNFGLQKLVLTHTPATADRALAEEKKNSRKKSKNPKLPTVGAVQHNQTTTITTISKINTVHAHQNKDRDQK